MDGQDGRQTLLEVERKAERVLGPRWPATPVTVDGRRHGEE